MALIDSSCNRLTALLAERIGSFARSELPKAAIADTQSRIIDAVAMMLAGASNPCRQLLLTTPGIANAPGPSLLFGTHRRSCALDAAWINAASFQAGDRDGDTGALPSGDAGPMLAMLIALAEERNASGGELIAAYATGLETMFRLVALADAAGGLGTTAAACRLLKLDTQKTAAALGIAVSDLSVTNANSPLRAGALARNCLLSALLAEGGHPVGADTLERALAAHDSILSADWSVPIAISFTGTLMDEAWEKFESCASRSLPRDQLAPLFERLETLQKLADIRSLTKLLQAAEVARPVADKITFAPRGEHEPEETTWVP